jgi:plastocyanin
MKMRSLLTAVLFGVLIASVVVISCSKNDNNSNNNNSNQIGMRGMVFSNTNLQVKTGVTVTWVNDDNTTHTVTANDGSFDSGNIAPGATFTHTFNAVGSVAYHCTIHPTMTGTIVVVSQ